MKPPTKICVVIAPMILVAGGLWFGFGVGIGRSNQKKIGVAVSSAESLRTASDLLKLRPGELQGVDIARMNLLCAQGLVGAEEMNITQSLATLDEIAARVQSETKRHLYRFQRNPAEFENSEGYFRMIMLAVVLAEDFHVKYAPNKIKSAAEAHLGDGFFGNAEDVFLYGLTGPKRQGTCSSLPVLQVAVGRRLGYPLKLVTTKGHLFVRWEDAKERFNIEAAGNGVNRFSDDYYRHWPLAINIYLPGSKSTAP